MFQALVALVTPPDAYVQVGSRLVVASIESLKVQLSTRPFRHRSK